MLSCRDQVNEFLAQMRDFTNQTMTLAGMRDSDLRIQRTTRAS